MSRVYDLGDGHTISYLAWHPNRKLNPHYDGIEDTEALSAIVGHYRSDNKEYCEGVITFDSPTARALNVIHQQRGYKPSALWQVHSWKPLTLSPSLLCTECGDHGYIRQAKWVRA